MSLDYIQRALQKLWRLTLATWPQLVRIHPSRVQTGNVWRGIYSSGGKLEWSLVLLCTQMLLNQPPRQSYITRWQYQCCSGHQAHSKVPQVTEEVDFPESNWVASDKGGVKQNQEKNGGKVYQLQCTSFQGCHYKKLCRSSSGWLKISWWSDANLPWVVRYRFDEIFSYLILRASKTQKEAHLMTITSAKSSQLS